MKRIQLAVIALFTLVTVNNVNAQDSNNPWAVTIGVNAVDVRSQGDFSSKLNDHSAVIKDCNTVLNHDSNN